MKIAFVTLPVAGHLNAMAALALKVQSRGHDVVLFSTLDAKERVLSTGLGFLPVGEEAFPIGSTHEVERGLSSLEGVEGVGFTFQVMGMIARATIRQLESLFSSEGFEAVAFDTYLPYLELSAMALGLPYAHVAVAVPFDVTGASPLCFFDWDDSQTPEARQRNMKGVDLYRQLLTPCLKVAQDYAAEVGLEVDWNDLSATSSKRAFITQLPKAFDFGEVDSVIRHTGPFIENRGRSSSPFPWNRLTGAPLVYASMGTLQNGREEVFHFVVAAARTLKNFQFVVVLGNKLDPATFEPLPENVILVASAPQLELLPRASLCITHAGLNTVLEALTNELPLVALPVTNDQPGVAARIKALGVGEYLDTSEITAEALLSVVQKVLADPSYRQNAVGIGNRLKDLDGLRIAAELIERAFVP